MNAGEINSLSKKIIQIEDDKQKEVKDLSSKRELERSRTSGMVSSRKESNQYIEKQLRKLNEDILEKTIAVENVNRELNKEKRRHEETVKSMKKKVDSLTEEYETQIKEKEEHFEKI